MFIGRRPDSSIYGLWTVRQWDGQEELPDNNPEVIAFMVPKPPTDLSNIDNLDKALKAIGLVLRDYSNQLLAGTYTNKTNAQLKADFAVKYQAIP